MPKNTYVCHIMTKDMKMGKLQLKIGVYLVKVVNSINGASNIKLHIWEVGAKLEDASHNSGS